MTWRTDTNPFAKTHSYLRNVLTSGEQNKTNWLQSSIVFCLTWHMYEFHQKTPGFSLLRCKNILRKWINETRFIKSTFNNSLISKLLSIRSLTDIISFFATFFFRFWQWYLTWLLSRFFCLFTWYINKVWLRLHTVSDTFDCVAFMKSLLYLHLKYFSIRAIYYWLTKSESVKL